MDERTERLKEFVRWYVNRLWPGDSAKVVTIESEGGNECRIKVGKPRKPDEMLKALLLPHVPDHDKPAAVAKAIATAAGIKSNSKVRTALSSLKKDGKIVSDKGGYRKKKGA
jgi:hypothetical protein